jgi:hypothetical protein
MPNANKGVLVAEGAYTYQRGDTTIGHETWKLEKFAHGGLVFASEIELTAPAASRLHFTYEVTQQWAPVHFTARIDGEGQSKTGVHRVAVAQWQATLETRGEKAEEQSLEFTPKHEVSFVSPVFVTPSLYRLNLQVGQSQPVDLIAIDASTLAPRAEKRTLHCVAEEKVEVPAGKFSAWHYTAKTDGSESEDHFWADRNGVVLSYQTADGETMKLTRYRRIERR